MQTLKLKTCKKIADAYSIKRKNMRNALYLLNLFAQNLPIEQLKIVLRSFVTNITSNFLFINLKGTKIC